MCNSCIHAFLCLTCAPERHFTNFRFTIACSSLHLHIINLLTENPLVPHIHQNNPNTLVLKISLSLMSLQHQPPQHHPPQCPFREIHHSFPKPHPQIRPLPHQLSWLRPPPPPRSRPHLHRTRNHQLQRSNKCLWNLRDWCRLPSLVL